MSSDCHRIEDLAGISELVSGDPRRTHLDECPRCQARMETFREFLHPNGEYDQAKFNQAMSKLGTDIDQEIFGPASNSDLGSDGSGSQSSGTIGVGRTAKPTIFHFRSPYVRGALALAACLLLLFAINDFTDHPDGDIGVLRSESTEQTSNIVTLSEPVYLTDGGIELNWQPVLEADAYHVEILSSELDEVAKLDVESGTSLNLTGARLAELLPVRGAYAWIVVALADGDEIARSRPSSFRFGS